MSINEFRRECKNKKQKTKNKEQETRNKEQGISLLAAVSQTAQARNTERRKDECLERWALQGSKGAGGDGGNANIECRRECRMQMQKNKKQKTRNKKQETRNKEFPCLPLFHKRHRQGILNAERDECLER
jgi:hypothetical protein